MPVAIATLERCDPSAFDGIGVAKTEDVHRDAFIPLAVRFGPSAEAAWPHLLDIGSVVGLDERQTDIYRRAG